MYTSMSNGSRVRVGVQGGREEGVRLPTLARQIQARPQRPFLEQHCIVQRYCECGRRASPGPAFRDVEGMELKGSG